MLVCTTYSFFGYKTVIMKLRGLWWRALLAGLVALAATLLHFHRECEDRREEERADQADRAARRYQPELGTDCQDTKLCFVSADKETIFGESEMGREDH